MTNAIHTIETGSLRLGFDLSSGSLVSLTAKRSEWQILNRPELGLSFRLLVPLRDPRDWHAAGQRNNPVYGEKQKLGGFEAGADGHSIRFWWDGVQPEHGDFLPIRVEMTVRAQADAVVFSMTLENHSEYVIENVYCPYLGDVQRPAQSAWFKTFLYNYASASEWSLWPTFQNMRGYFGVDYPTQFSPWGPGAGAPMSPYILLRGENEGFYAGVAEAASELVAWHTELRPGWGSSIDSRVPETLTVPGPGGKELPVHTLFAAVHTPYIQPGETRSLTPVMLSAFQGGWQQGVDIYTSWRDTWMKLPEIPAWAREPHAWQQVHINSPEDELRVPFRDLPRIGEECARHGVKAIQLVGWNDGGQDQGNPSHDPDPRLGTFEELKEAIARIQALGVKVILFAKFTWADRGTQRFRAELERLAVKDPYGDYYHYGGYQYQTATQLLDINTKRLVPMCFLSEEYLRVCEEEFQKILDLGAAGFLFDECLHHSPALLCFDERHGHRYGAMVYANDRKLIQNFGRLSKETNPDFLFAGEACYDWEMEVYHVSYHRSENKTHIPLSRYMLPEGLFMTAVTGFNDRNMINQCLMYRYIISYEPYNFKGSLEDYPETLAYGKQMDALRTDLREYFWDGEFHDTIGAQVTAGGKAHHPYSVFTSRATGAAGLVICNYEDEPATVEARLDSGQPLARWRLVGEETWRPLATGGIVIPARSAVVVV